MNFINNSCHCNESADRKIVWEGKTGDQTTYLCDWHFKEWQEGQLARRVVWPKPEDVIYIIKLERGVR